MSTAVTQPPGPTEAPAPGGRAPVAALGILVVALVAALTIAFVRWPAGATADPAEDSAAAGFSRDMQEHHAQAVEMSMIVRDRTQDEDVRRLAYDIALGQQYQIGAMGSWLRVWGLSQTGSGPSMAWMDHSEQAKLGHAGHDGDAPAMPGMARAADLDELRTLSGRAAELKYLTLMIPHHRGGVEMAEAVLARTEVPVVRDLAQQMANAQAAEIGAMNDMISARGGTPV